MDDDLEQETRKIVPQQIRDKTRGCVPLVQKQYGSVQQKDQGIRRMTVCEKRLGNRQS